jgi:hypothetical protein
MENSSTYFDTLGLATSRRRSQSSISFPAIHSDSLVSGFVLRRLQPKTYFLMQVGGKHQPSMTFLAGHDLVAPSLTDVVGMRVASLWNCDIGQRLRLVLQPYLAIVFFHKALNR